MRINTNINAMTATNQSARNTALAGNSMNKLSSGLRINKAGDDAAGLAISEKMRSQIRGMEQADRNVQDGISLVQTAEGATEEIGNIVQRMRELSVQASNETNTASDRTKITEELTQLNDEINRIADSTKFNGKNVLNGDTVLDTKMAASMTNSDFNIEGLQLTKADGATGLTEGNITIKTEQGTATGTKITVNAGGQTFTLDNSSVGTKSDNLGAGTYTLKATDGQEITLTVGKNQTVAFAGTEVIGTNAKKETIGSELSLQVGANTSASEGLNVKIVNVNTESLGLTQARIDAMKAEGTTGTTAAKAMIDSLDKALETVNTSRANLGAMQNRLEATSSNLTTSTENLSAAESRIRDVDVAKEMINLSKLNLLSQASQAMTMQAKSQPESVMQLLR